MKPYEQAILPDTDPRSVEQKLVALIFNEETPSKAKLDQLLTFVPTSGNWLEDLESVREQVFSSLRQLFDLGLSRENVVDMILSSLDLLKEGDDAYGYRLSGSGMGSAMPIMFVIREGGAYKIIGSADSMENVGHRVLELLKKKDLEGAQWWLDHSVPNIPTPKDAWLPAAQGLWPGTVASPRGPDAARVAAASLIGWFEGSADAVAILKEASSNSKEASSKPVDAIRKSQIDQALCEAYAKGRQWNELASTARRLLASRTFHGAGFEFLMRALEGQSDWKAMETAAVEETKNKSAERDAWKYVAIARIAAGNGSAAEAIERFKSLAMGGEAVELTAWNEIRQKKVSENTLDAVKKIDGAVQVRDPYLAALMELELHKTEDAQESLKQAIQTGDVNALDARALVIYGGICEQYGFTNAANAARARARNSKAQTRAAQWALAFANGVEQ